MSKNLEAYLRLNKTRYKNLYVVLVDGKLVAKGKAIDKILRNVRKSHPRKVPFVAKVPGDEVLVLSRVFATARSVLRSAPYTAPSQPSS